MTTSGLLSYRGYFTHCDLDTKHLVGVGLKNAMVAAFKAKNFTLQRVLRAC